MNFKEFLTEHSFDGTHVNGGGLYKRPLFSRGPKPPRSVLAAFTDQDGYTVSIAGQVQGAEDAFGRTGVMRITNPEGKQVRAGYWMGWPEDEWNISDKEWKKLTWEDRAALEVKQQATKYQPLKQQFEHFLEIRK